MKKEDSLVPVKENDPKEHSATRVEEDYQRAKRYFWESFSQALKTNAALLTVLGLFVARGLRYAWEAVSRYFPWRR